jgi:hypothetical protein
LGKVLPIDLSTQPIKKNIRIHKSNRTKASLKLLADPNNGEADKVWRQETWRIAQLKKERDATAHIGAIFMKVAEDDMMENRLRREFKIRRKPKIRR